MLHPYRLPLVELRLRFLTASCKEPCQTPIEKTAPYNESERAVGIFFIEDGGGQEDGGKDDDHVDHDEDFLNNTLRQDVVELLMKTMEGLDNLKMLMKARKEHMYESKRL